MNLLLKLYALSQKINIQFGDYNYNYNYKKSKGNMNKTCIKMKQNRFLSNSFETILIVTLHPP